MYTFLPLSVILSEAKNPSPFPFASLRVRVTKGVAQGDETEPSFTPTRHSERSEESQPSPPAPL